MPFPDPPQVFGLSESELIELGFSRVETISEGLLNDRSIVGALYWVLAAQAAEIAQYGSQINLIPEAVIQQWLYASGVRRLAAQRALVPVVITLTQRFPDEKVIPVGFKAAVGSTQFELVQDVTIPPGVASSEGAEVFMQAVEPGTSGNIAAGSEWTIITGLSFVASISNSEPTRLGSEIESEDSLIDRAIAAIRGNSLVDDPDFEQAAVEFLGEGSSALCIPLLGADKATYEVGAVHLFVLDASGNPPTQVVLNELAQALAKRAILKLVYASAMDVVPISVRVIADLSPGFDQQLVAEAIKDRMISYLSPGNLPPGESVYINEAEFQVRLVTGVQRVVSVSFADDDNIPRRLDLQLPYVYSAPNVVYLSVTLVSGAQSFTKEWVSL